MLKKSFLVSKIALLLLLCLVFSACSISDTVKENPSYSFTDALGRNVVLDNKPVRVAALIGSFADVWMLAGGDICAAPVDAWEDFKLPLKDAVNIGGAHSPSLEAVLSSEPDFVLASASTSSNVKLKASFEKMGIPVAYFDVDSFSDYLAMLKICTDITGRTDLNEINGAEVEKKIKKIKDGIKLKDNEKKILLLRISPGLIKSKGSEGTVLGEILSDSGLINIADNDKALLENLNIESIVKENPYRIFVAVMGDDHEAAKENLTKLLSENPAWSNLDAVKNNRIHIMERELFHIKPNEKWAQSYEQLEKILKSK